MRPVRISHFYFTNGNIFSEIKNLESFYTTTFEDIGMEPVISAEIQNLLVENNIVLSDKELRKLSFAKIESMLEKQ